MMAQFGSPLLFVTESFEILKPLAEVGFAVHQLLLLLEVGNTLTSGEIVGTNDVVLGEVEDDIIGIVVFGGIVVVFSK